MAEIREYKLFIDGEWVDSLSGETFDSVDPSTGKVIASVARAGREDVRRAIDVARKAFDSGVWSDLSLQERTNRMLEAAEVLKEKVTLLSETEALDAGQTIRLASLFTIPLGVEHWRALAELAHRLGEEEPVARSDIPAPSWGMVRREPYGVCAAITPWNFPFILMIWKVAAALAAGNTVVVKPASYTPLSTLEFARILQETDLFPPGVINIAPGSGAVAGEELVSNPLVDRVAFTGSTEVGRRIMELAAPTVKRITLELGGKSPNILLDDADLDAAVPGALWGVFLHQGQVCHAGTRCFVPASIYDDVVSRMVELAETLKIGKATDYESDLGPLIDRSQYETVDGYVQTGLEEGAKLVTGGEAALVDGSEGGYYYKPTIFTEVENSMRIAQEEIFGPVLSVIRYDSVEDVIRTANDTIYGLAAAVWSSDVPRALEVAKRLRAGTVWINDYHLVSGYGPFGGYKQSGFGRELGSWGLREYQQTKYIQVDQLPRREQKFWFQVMGL
jgi:acyl-CoA reductase-like NAD-dependent aldehyde dehydrogenase